MRETPSISHIDRLDLSFAPKPWDFAVERRDEIDAFFAALRRDKPSIWNGRVLMLHHHAMKDGVLHGEYLDKVDLELSVRRELHEETGLSVAEFASEPGWTMITDGPLMAQIKVLRSGEDSVALRKRVMLHLASEQHPELADIRIIRKHKDLDPAMPRFVTAFLESRLGSS
jgi:8-oxo-dGTP pyrophosphatase MutT (NUDIX family)